MDRRYFTNVAATMGGQAPTLVTRLAHTLLGPGNSSGTGTTTSNGSLVSNSITLVNRSGAPITIATVIFQSWFLSTTGTTATGNSYNIDACTLEYPVGSSQGNIQSGGSNTIPTTSGNLTICDPFTLSTPIPAGASFKVTFASTVPNLSKYITTNFGFAGLCTTAMSNTIKKAAYGMGDSIVTNNGALWLTAGISATVPTYQASISGTTAQAYAAGGALTRQIVLAQALGVDRIVTDWVTNDLAFPQTAATVLGYQATMRALANAVGIKWTCTTCTPRVGSLAVSVISLTSVGNIATITVANGALYQVGECYAVTGAVQSEYNTRYFIESIVGNVLTASFIGSVTPTATGTIVITQYAITVRAQEVANTGFEAGTSSQKGIYNTALRNGTNSASDGFIELAGGCELVLNDSLWMVGGESPFLLAPHIQTVTSIITTSRWFVSPGIAANAASGGVVGFRAGSANPGYQQGINGNGGTDITLNSATPNVTVVGDTFWAQPQVCNATADGLHPRVTQGTSFGGQMLIQTPANAYFAANF